MSARVPITFFIITKDEEQNLPHALASVIGWAADVFVLDSGSTDGTREIATRLGASFYEHPWQGYVRQKNWGLANLPITTPWVFILDADESITPPLRDELTALATADTCEPNGFYVNRYFIFLGRRIRHCGYYPSWNIRFFRRGKAVYEQRDVHEHMVVDGAVGFLKHDMEHDDRRGLEYYIAKHNRYSTLEARAMYLAMTGRSRAAAGSLRGGPLARRRWVKDHVWPRLPARWTFRFFYMYVLRLGVLDGWVGLQFCLFLAAYEHQIGLKLAEFQARGSADPVATSLPAASTAAPVDLALVDIAPTAGVGPASGGHDA